ncbi:MULTISPECIES: hypothetical protein [unclassified Pseudoalteromonas]|uniref:hypothetical protein n=1 Tax=unclassified Pseudoalteromonas TaxID=194690 RepID=UPI003014F6EA
MIFLLFSLLLINIIVTCMVVASDVLDGFQKKAQAFLIWFLPFFGAVGIFIFLYTEKKNSTHKVTFENNSKTVEPKNEHFGD